MKRREQIIATTHVDSHRERLALSALNMLVQDIKTAYIPLWVEHDPRIPPRGRVVDAWIKKLEDGESGVVAVIEEFEVGETPVFDGARRMKIGEAECDLSIRFDRTYRDRQSRALIADLATLLKVAAKQESKKSAEPISVLTFIAKAALGKIAETFWSGLSDETYKAVKAKLGILFRNRRKKSDDYIFRYRCVVIVGGREVEVDFLATAPSDERIERIFKQHLAAADKILQEYLPEHPEIARVVFDAGGAELKFSFAVRTDAVPVYSML